MSVNWCPALGTVLANEEVINGLSERGNHPVIRTPLRFHPSTHLLNVLDQCGFFVLILFEEILVNIYVLIHLYINIHLHSLCLSTCPVDNAVHVHRQWVLKITQYADQLEEGLKDMNWPEGTLTAQKQWIGTSIHMLSTIDVLVLSYLYLYSLRSINQSLYVGKSEGCLIKFAIPDSSSMIEVFTTRPDTVMGVTYVVLAPEHR